MLTIMIHATVKEEELDNFKVMASMLTKEARESHEGCITYVFNQRSDRPAEFVLYEQWESESCLEAHMDKMVALIGPAMPGTQLPEKLINMYEKAEPVYYSVVE